jgi:hypothetical protein
MLRKLSVVILGIAVIFLVTASSHAFRDDIVAAWTMDEGSGDVIGDVSGNGNDAELAGGVEWSDGRSGKALSFDGSSGYIEIPFSESMKLINQGGFTLAAWIMTPDANASDMAVFQQLDSNGTGRTWLEVVKNEIKSYLGGGSTVSGVQVEAGEWYHAAVTVTEGGDSDTVQMYVNGEPAGNSSVRSMEDSEGNFVIGRYKGQSGFWHGAIDDVVLIGKALSADDLSDLMTNGVVIEAAVEPSGKLAVSWGSVKGSTRP